MVGDHGRPIGSSDRSRRSFAAKVSTPPTKRRDQIGVKIAFKELGHRI